jgi:hypothetical protein
MKKIIIIFTILVILSRVNAQIQVPIIMENKKNHDLYLNILNNDSLKVLPIASQTQVNTWAERITYLENIEYNLNLLEKNVFSLETLRFQPKNLLIGIKLKNLSLYYGVFSKVNNSLIELVSLDGTIYNFNVQDIAFIEKYRNKLLLATTNEFLQTDANNASASLKIPENEILAKKTRQMKNGGSLKIPENGILSKKTRQIKNGGIVVYEKNGHGLVVAPTDLEPSEWNDAKIACGKLVLNGYSDWRLPTKKELNSLYMNRDKIDGLGAQFYWSSTEWTDYGNVWGQYLDDNSPQYSGLQQLLNKNDDFYKVRAVRTF